MYYSNLLASMGEVTLICVDEYLQGTNEKVVSHMLFLPKDISVLSQKQVFKIKKMLAKIGDGLFALALCNGYPMM